MSDVVKNAPPRYDWHEFCRRYKIDNKDVVANDWFCRKAVSTYTAAAALLLLHEPAAPSVLNVELVAPAGRFIWIIIENSTLVHYGLTRQRDMKWEFLPNKSYILRFVGKKMKVFLEFHINFPCMTRNVVVGGKVRYTMEKSRTRPNYVRLSF